MSKFKLGDKVIAIKNHSKGDYKVGDEFIVTGFSCCPGCGEPTIRISGKDEIVNSSCRICKFLECFVVNNYFETSFEKPISISECIEYKLKVSLPELTELKELQNQ